MATRSTRALYLGREKFKDCTRRWDDAGRRRRIPGQPRLARYHQPQLSLLCAHRRPATHGSLARHDLLSRCLLDRMHVMCVAPQDRPENKKCNPSCTDTYLSPLRGDGSGTSQRETQVRGDRRTLHRSGIEHLAKPVGVLCKLYSTDR